MILEGLLITKLWICCRILFSISNLILFSLLSLWLVSLMHMLSSFRIWIFVYMLLMFLTNLFLAYGVGAHMV